VREAFGPTAPLKEFQEAAVGLVVGVTGWGWANFVDLTRGPGRGGEDLAQVFDEATGCVEGMDEGRDRFIRGEDLREELMDSREVVQVQSMCVWRRDVSLSEGVLGGIAVTGRLVLRQQWGTEARVQIDTAVSNRLKSCGTIERLPHPNEEEARREQLQETRPVHEAVLGDEADPVGARPLSKGTNEWEVLGDLSEEGELTLEVLVRLCPNNALSPSRGDPLIGWELLCHEVDGGIAPIKGVGSQDSLQVEVPLAVELFLGTKAINDKVATVTEGEVADVLCGTKSIVVRDDDIKVKG
jgi:hypothetical protein